MARPKKSSKVEVEKNNEIIAQIVQIVEAANTQPTEVQEAVEGKQEEPEKVELPSEAKEAKIKVERESTGAVSQGIKSSTNKKVTYFL